MNFLSPQTVLWFSAQALQLAVLVCMYRRRIQNYYPAFFYFIVVEVLSDPFLTLVQDRCPYTYYFGYWITVCLTTALSFFVMQEIFRDAFRPFEALRDLSTILFRWSALVLLLVAGMSAVTAPYNAHVDSISNTILLVDRNVRVMLCGLVFFLLMFSEYLGISRRHVLFGVAVGFGFISHSHAGRDRNGAPDGFASQHAVRHQQRRLCDCMPDLAGLCRKSQDVIGRRNRARPQGPRMERRPGRSPRAGSLRKACWIPWTRPWRSF